MSNHNRMRFCAGKMSRRRSRTPRLPKTASTCCFCGISEDNEVEYGKLYTHKGIVTHYYCLLLSSNMQQNGKDNQGILGFMPSDIQKELRRGKRLACSYCRKVGATLGCCNSRCKRVFHLPCGLQAGSLHQFFDEFRSYCVTHRLKQEIDEHIKEEAAAAGTVTCYICYEEVNPQNTIRTLWAPCCRKNAWFHRKCVQRLALSAGYFFKCPLCNNNQEFQKAMLEHGIFIPNQDASWELVPNAYQELLHRHNCCDAAECLCPKGRSYTSLNAKWELVLCRLCGSQGVHKACGRLKWTNSYWECDECVDMLHKSDNEPASPRGNKIKKVSVEISDDESSNDSDISVGQNPSPLPVIERPESPPAVTPPVRIRPGPLSFKLQQAVKCLKSVESTKLATANTSTSCDILRSILSTNRTDSKNKVSNEKSNDEALQTPVFPKKKTLPPILSAGTQITSTPPKEGNASLEAEKGESVEPKRRLAEVILIESDDEVEIISIKSKPNILTTMDGTKIKIHNLPQVGTEPKVLGDLKFEYQQAELLKLASSQSQNIPAANRSILPKKSSSTLNPLSPTSPASITPYFGPLSVPKSPVSSKTTMPTSRKKLFENTGVSNPIAGKVDQNSVMNLKITNVTSVPIEDFANGDSPMNPGPQVRIIQAPDQNNGTLKPRTMAFGLSSAAVKDINVKRRSTEYNCAVSNFIDTKVMDQCKRARISASDPLPAQQSTTYTWGINLNNMNGGIPIITKSVSTTQTNNSNKFELSTATIQRKPNESLISCNNGVRTVYSLEIQKINGVHKYPSTAFVANSAQSQVNNNANRLNMPSSKPSAIGSQQNFVYQPHIIKRIPATSVPASSINVHESTHRNQQYLVTSSANLQDSLSSLNTAQGLTQPVFSINKSTALSGGMVRVYQSPKNRNKELQRHNDKSGLETVQTNLGEVTVYNGVGKSITENPTVSGGNQPNASSMLKTGPSITQLPNGITIPSGCDGDAGSSPAAKAGPHHQATPTSQLHPPSESVSFTDAVSGPEQRVGADSSISILGSTIPAKYVQRYSSFKTEGKRCDKPGLIPENVPLQDLKFRIVESEIIEIIVCDNYKLNVNANMGNPDNKKDAPGPQRWKKKENLVPSSAQHKFGAIKLNHNIQPINNCSPKSQACSKTTVSLEESRSPKRSLNNSTISNYKFDNKKVSNTATYFAEDKTKASRLSETKCSIGSKIPETSSVKEIFPNKKSLASVRIEGRDRSSLCTQSAENLSKVMVSSELSNNGWNSKQVHEKDCWIFSNEKCKYFSDNVIKTAVKRVEQKNTAVDFCSKIHEDEKKRDRSSLCTQSAENLSKVMVSSELSNNGWNSKQVHEKDCWIFSNEKCKYFSDNVIKTAVKRVEQKNTAVDFCSKIHEDEKKRSYGLTRVSTCLAKNLLDSSKMNLPIDCYSNYRGIDRSSELNSNVKDFDAGVRDSSMNNGIKDDNLRAENGLSQVLADPKAQKSKELATLNLNDSELQIIDKNTNLSVVKVNCESINSGVGIKDELGSCVDKNGYGGESSESKVVPSGLKVKINLNRIQRLVDNKPELFYKSNYVNNKCTNERVSETSPLLSSPRSFYSNGTKRRSNFSNSETSRIEQRNTEYSNARKRFKYNSGLFREHSKS